MTIKVKIPGIFSIHKDKFKGVDVNILYKRVLGDSMGIDIAAIKRVDDNRYWGNNFGIDLTLGKKVEGDNMGVDITLKRYIDGDSKGFNIAIISNLVNCNSSGLDITGLMKFVDRDNNGIDIVGLWKSVGSDSHGSNYGIDIIVGGKHVSEDNKGVDLIGGFKNVGKNNNGVDLVGGVKVVGGNNTGISLTGLYNYFEEVNDWSISYGILGNTINEVGEDSFYLQLGLFNKAGSKYFPFIQVGGIKNIPSIIKKNLEKILKKSI